MSLVSFSWFFFFPRKKGFQGLTLSSCGCSRLIVLLIFTLSCVYTCPSLGCCNKNTILDGLHITNKRIYFSLFWRPEFPRAGWQHGDSSGKNPLLDCRLPASHFNLIWGRVQRGNKLSCDSIRALIPFMRAPPSWPYLILFNTQRHLLLIVPHYGGKVLPYEFWRYAFIVSIMTPFAM